jgi:hypothetical protein
MTRYRQVYDEEAQKYKLVEISGRESRESHFIHGDIDPFVSPVDGSVISDRRQLEEHNKRHGVVNASEFSDEYYAKKAEERARYMRGETSRQETLERKRQMWELMHRG